MASRVFNGPYSDSVSPLDADNILMVLWRSTPRERRGAIAYVQSRYLLKGMESEALPSFGTPDGPDIVVWGQGIHLHVQVLLARQTSEGCFEIKLPKELGDSQLVAVIPHPGGCEPDVICLNPLNAPGLGPRKTLPIQAVGDGDYRTGAIRWPNAETIWNQFLGVSP